MPRMMATESPTETVSAPIELARTRAMARDGLARTIRVGARLTLLEVGRACGVTESTVYRWETGSRVPRGEAASRYGRLLAELLTR